MTHSRIAIIGGGPAGLRAAELASEGDSSVTLFDAKRSVGRKFLVAGKGGLNLTNAEPLNEFAKRFHGPDQPPGFWEKALAGFTNDQIRAWAARLDVGTFAARNGRVYPKALKAAPLLRRWVQRLKEQSVQFHVNHRLRAITPGTPHTLTFDTPDGEVTATADTIILGLGGGSWPNTGSDGAWTETLDAVGIATNPLSPANCGWNVDWPEGFIEKHEATPLKNLLLHASGKDSVGELIISRTGLEGGPLYALGPALRSMEQPSLIIDFKPTFTLGKLLAKMESARRNFLHEAQLRWKLPPAACDLIEATHGPIESAEQLAPLVKAYPLSLSGARPLAEAISSAGGVSWSELDENLMLRKLPGIFLAGEMIDWEAPTGGYLIQGCFSTGTLAAQSALAWLTVA
ncbi:MAG: TIGR03862 family flavoprotein [Akkermansiaceae bacterium]|jgi:uncharacterized flavoprotein (TIGR03862 family)|nr:TIGR03862 family flavoprotein [Akkermansiaceae bacterium]